MPTNLPPDARKKWVEVETAKNPKEKLRLTIEFLSLVPKHKGTAKLCAQIKKQMAIMRQEIEEKKRKKAGKVGSKFFIEKEGAAQIVIIGLTNVGKSNLVTAITNAKVEVSSNPYNTKKPVPGIMTYQDVQFQIVEAPALMEGSSVGRAWGLRTLALARNADGLILMVDLSQNPVGQLSLILSEMEKARILVSKPKGHVDIERKAIGTGLRLILFGKLIDCTVNDIEKLLKSYRITEAVVKISGEATLEDIEEAIFENTVYKTTIIAANKIDLKSSRVNLKLLKTYVDEKLPIIVVSCAKRYGLEKLGENMFKMLDIMRIYTKELGKKEFSKSPFTLKKGSKVYDLAKNIHSDFRNKFAFAKIWSKRLIFSPQKVGLEFLLEDGDIVEIHVK